MWFNRQPWIHISSLSASEWKVDRVTLMKHPNLMTKILLGVTGKQTLICCLPSALTACVQRWSSVCTGGQVWEQAKENGNVKKVKDLQKDRRKG